MKMSVTTTEGKEVCYVDTDVAPTLGWRLCVTDDDDRDTVYEVAAITLMLNMQNATLIDCTVKRLRTCECRR